MKYQGGGVHQLNNNQLFNLQLFADTLNYNEVDNPYKYILVKNTYVRGDIKEVYNLNSYYKKIPNYDTITTLPEENAKYIKEALPNVTDCGSMLYNCTALTSIDTTGWDTSNITSMGGMFYKCFELTTLDVSNWNTSKVTNMSYMFDYCSSLTSLDISNWDTSNVIYMYNMFYDCKTLTSLDVSKFNTSKVTSMSYMFYDCNKLTTIDVSKWNTSKVTNMYGMFDYCSSLTSLDIYNWDTSNVTKMGWMFEDCKSLTTITGVIDMKSCTSYDGMFNGCSKLTGVKIKNPPSGFTDTYASEISSGKIVIVQ